MMKKTITRRDFLRWIGVTAGGMALTACAWFSQAVSQVTEAPDRDDDAADVPELDQESPSVEVPEDQEPAEDEPAYEDLLSEEDPSPEEERGEGEPAAQDELDLGELAGLPFLMPIEDIFSVKGRGTVVTGRVRRGTLEVGDQVEIVGGSEVLSTIVTGIEQFRKTIEAAFPDENVGSLLRGINRDDLQRGQVVAEPSSIAAYESFNAEISILTQEEGGGKVVFNGYRPQVFIWTDEVAGEITLLDDMEMIQPGESGAVQIQLIKPTALEVGTEFAFREGGRTIGTGMVTELLN